MEYSLSALAYDFRQLAEKRVTDRRELEAWYEEAKRVPDRIRADSAVANELPHFLWHYLADADIRLKDADFAREQNTELLRLLALMEQVGPGKGSDGRSGGRISRRCHEVGCAQSRRS